MGQKDHLVVALDIGGTNFRLAVIDSNGHILRQHKDHSYPEQGPEQAIKRIGDEATELLENFNPDSIRGMGIAIAGLVNPVTGILLTSPNLLSWYNTPLKDIFEQELQLPVSIGNDANLAVLGEHRYGAGNGSEDIIYLTVSTGIGGGVITGGKLLLGSTGFAAELGHMTIDINGPRCTCGNIGCLEVMASGTAIARLARESLSKGKPSSITELVSGDLTRVTAAMVAEAARSGDVLASEIMYTAATNLGVGVVNLVHIFNPERVIIGGGVSQAGEMIFEPVQQVVAERIMPDIIVDILPAKLGDDSGLLGAATLVLDSTPG